MITQEELEPYEDSSTNIQALVEKINTNLNQSNTLLSNRSGKNCPQVNVVRGKVDFKWLSCRQIVPSRITS